MYATYKCENCHKIVYPFKVYHLEDGNVICNNCYYEAQEITGKTLMTMKDISEAGVSEDQMRKKELEFLRRIRKLAQHNNEPEKDILRDFANLLNSISNKHYNKGYCELYFRDQRTVLERLTTLMHTYFRDAPPHNILDSSIKLSKTYKLSDFKKMLHS